MSQASPEPVQQRALEAAQDQVDASSAAREGVVRRNRGKLGLALGLVAGLVFSPRIQCMVAIPQTGEMASAPSADSETQARVLGVLACRLDENGQAVCIPLAPEEFGELDDCIPGAPEGSETQL